MNIDERLQALTMNLELAFRDIQELGVKIDRLTGHMETLAISMSELARVVRDDEQRLGNLEGQ